MKCPYCTTEISPRGNRLYLEKENSRDWYAVVSTCPFPECKKLIIYLLSVNQESVGERDIHYDKHDVDIHNLLFTELSEGAIEALNPVYFPVKPKSSTRPPCPPEVDDQDIVEDYKEACLVLADSPKASAALSRRCLQHLLQKKASVNPGDKLYKQINDAMQGLPTYLRDEIDDIRELGNIATHPIASKTTGVIAPVEPAEAEAMLGILEGLFDFYYVLQARSKQRKQAIQDKKK